MVLRRILFFTKSTKKEFIRIFTMAFFTLYLNTGHIHRIDATRPRAHSPWRFPNSETISDMSYDKPCPLIANSSGLVYVLFYQLS